MTVEETIKEITNPEGKQYLGKSTKDEINVMKAMLNDTDYQVGIYNKNGYQGNYNPGKSIRNMMSNVLSDATGITKIESNTIIDKYKFNNNDAKDMLDFSKEFFNTYLFQTGKKVGLGGREHHNASLQAKNVPAGFYKFPVKVADGVYESGQGYRQGYSKLVAQSPYPAWLKTDQPTK